MRPHKGRIAWLSDLLVPSARPFGRKGEDDACADWCEMAVNPAWAEHADRDVVTAISRPRGRLAPAILNCNSFSFAKRRNFSTGRIFRRADMPSGYPGVVDRIGLSAQDCVRRLDPGRLAPSSGAMFPVVKRLP
jgi:hypothetical protein